MSEQSGASRCLGHRGCICLRWGWGPFFDSESYAGLRRFDGTHDGCCHHLERGTGPHLKLQALEPAEQVGVLDCSARLAPLKRGAGQFTTHGNRSVALLPHQECRVDRRRAGIDEQSMGRRRTVRQTCSLRKDDSSWQ